LFPSSNYLLIPDEAHPLAPLVKFRGAKPEKGNGGIYFLDVRQRKASLLEDFFSAARPDGAQLVPAAAVTTPGVSESENARVELQSMVRSQQIAAAVALRHLGYKVIAKATGALVSDIAADGPTAGVLVPGDVIVAVDGHPVATPSDAKTLLSKHRPGDTVHVRVRGAKGLRTVSIRTIADPADPSHPLIGVLLEQSARISLPFPITIATGNVGGPSAGLAFALELVEKLGRDVDRGYKVAATGEIFLDGSVGPIGGVRQKIFGARQSGVDILLAPAGDNADLARKYAGRVRIIPVETFAQALHALATLPRKH
jgi:PDZ domain-containing protein